MHKLGKQGQYLWGWGRGAGGAADEGLLLLALAWALVPGHLGRWLGWSWVRRLPLQSKTMYTLLDALPMKQPCKAWDKPARQQVSDVGG